MSNSWQSAFDSELEQAQPLLKTELEHTQSLAVKNFINQIFFVQENIIAKRSHLQNFFLATVELYRKTWMSVKHCYGAELARKHA